MLEKINFIKKFNEFDDEEYEELIHKSFVFLMIELAIVILLTVVYILLVSYTVTNVYVEGNEHYTAAQVRRLVENTWFGDNSLYLSIKYSGNNTITDIPFVEKIDVDVLDRNSIKITVYEKTLAGYVEYLDSFIYFDKDGIVVESSNIRTAGIPLVTGLSYDHFVMYEQLPVDNPDVFQTVLNITQLLNKYSIVTDRIYFNEHGEITLYFDDIRVNLGSTALLEEKIQRLDAILPELKGKSGYLEMGTYDNGKESFTFTSD